MNANPKVPLYEQAFEYKGYNSPNLHQLFFDKLRQVLPEELCLSSSLMLTSVLLDLDY